MSSPKPTISFLHDEGTIEFEYYPAEPQTGWYPGAPAEIVVISYIPSMTEGEAESAAWDYMTKLFAEEDERIAEEFLDADPDPDLDVPY